MPEWKLLLTHSLTVFNILFACYFVAGNGMYMLLMLLSLLSVWLNNRRRAYENLDYLRQSPVTPPVTIIIPAWNEEGIIIETVRATLKTDYPALEIVVVDDGSTDSTLGGLIEAFGLSRTDAIYRPHRPTRRVKAIYLSPLSPRLLVIHKERGGKSDALNAGINLCRTPYFCTLDADCVLERDALLRLMRPIIRSRSNTVASGGIVRILNGCEVRGGHVAKVGLPANRLQRFQVVEYLRAFLFGRTGWDVLRGTMIMSGAFTVFHRETVMEAGGFSVDTVTEDMELIVRLRRWATDHRRKIKMAFTSDSVCWTDSPASFGMLARQRRRWQVGLCQTLWKNAEMLFNPKYGSAGLLSYPFHLYIEALGAVVEFLGYLLIPFALIFRATLPDVYIPFLVLGLVCATFLSVGSVVLEELTHRRYPSSHDFKTLLLYALLENFGYRQVVLCFRFQGVLRFLMGSHRWEKVTHAAAVSTVKALPAARSSAIDGLSSL
jgi:cellulose synthase/poly-beta-1,6-N-acetylglucosamine synthase-like glycosyltransferase